MKVPVGVNGGLLGGLEQNFSSADHCGGVTSPICKPHPAFSATQSGNSSKDKQKGDIIESAELNFFLELKYAFFSIAHET